MNKLRMDEKVNTNTALLIIGLITLLVGIWIDVGIADPCCPTSLTKPEVPSLKHTSVNNMFALAYGKTIFLQNKIEDGTLTDFQIERLRIDRQKAMEKFVGSIAYFRGEVINAEEDGSVLKVAIKDDWDARHPYTFVVYIYKIPIEDLEDLYIGFTVVGWGKVTKFEYTNCLFPGRCFWIDLNLQQWKK